ncbi:Aldehyde dehydrogenase [Pseudonocardia sp. Ae168_Ps1]|nr:Aldehyde dehydrogenase [Pseudonocardia sp. Ae168_Ps1]
MIWVYGPLLWTGALSVLDWNLISPDPEFVGVENYVELFGRPETTNAIVRTGFYVLGMLPFATVIPMTLALLLWRRPGRAAEAYRALLFSPVVLAPLATAISWKFLLSPEQGLVDTVLSGSGLPSPNWLGDPRTALPVIVVITAGKIVALNVVLFSAALAGIDRRSIEAARIDGATGWETTRYVVLPQLARTVVLLTALCVVVAGQWVFTNVAVLTRGGPDGATGRRGDGATGRRGDGATGRRGDGATGRRGDGQHLLPALRRGLRLLRRRRRVRTRGHHHGDPRRGVRRDRVGTEKEPRCALSCAGTYRSRSPGWVCRFP